MANNNSPNPYGNQPGNPYGTNPYGNNLNGNNPYGSNPYGPDGAHGPCGPYHPGDPALDNPTYPFAPQPDNFNQQPDNGNTSKTVALIIVGLILAIVVVLAGILVTSDEKDNSAAGTGSDFTSTLTNPTDALGETATGEADPAEPDGTLNPIFIEGLPPILAETLRECAPADFELDYQNSAIPNRIMPGMQCSGTTRSPFTLHRVDLINDAEYATDVIEREKLIGATIISDTPDNFAGYSGNGAATLFIANPQTGRVLEVENFLGGASAARTALQELGYSAP